MTRQIEFGWQIITLLAIGIISILLIWPMTGMFLRSVYVAGEGFTLSGYSRLISQQWPMLANTAILGITVTTLSVAAGGGLAYLVTRFKFPLVSIVAFIPIVAFVVPDIVVAQSWILLLGNNGIVTKLFASIGIRLPSLYSWTGIIIVMTFQNYAYAYAAILAGLKGMDRSLEEAARGLGHSPATVARRVTIPLLTPSIFAAVLLVFTHVINSFGIPAVLGFRIPVLSVAIYNEFLNERGSHPLFQSAMSTFLVLIGISLLWLQKRYVEGRDYRMQNIQPPVVSRPGKGAQAGMTAVGLVFILASVLPLTLVVLSSVSQASGPNISYGTLTLANFERIFSTTAWRALSNTLYLTCIATVASTLFAILTAYCIVKKRSGLTSVLDVLLTVPLTVAGTVLGIALVGTFNSGFLVLTGGPLILVIAYFFRRMPFGVRSATGALYSLSDSIEEAAINLGVSPLAAFFKVIVPVMWPAVLAAAILIWVTTLSELSATLVLYGGGLATLPVEIYQQIDSNRTAISSAFSVVLLAVVFAPLVLARIFGLSILKTKP